MRPARAATTCNEVQSVTALAPRLYRRQQDTSASAKATVRQAIPAGGIGGAVIRGGDDGLGADPMAKVIFSETPLCKRAARAAFQIALEISGLVLSGERDGGFDVPRTQRRRGLALAAIVGGQAESEIRCLPDVKAIAIPIGLQDVDITKSHGIPHAG